MMIAAIPKFRANPSNDNAPPVDLVAISAAGDLRRERSRVRAGGLHPGHDATYRDVLLYSAARILLELEELDRGQG